MARPDLRTRQAKAAQAYMHHKGLNALPHNVIAIEDDLCWYFYYNLPDGCLELEVSWERTPIGGQWRYQTMFLEDADRTVAATGR